jgi:hypothetical protein
MRYHLTPTRMPIIFLRVWGVMVSKYVEKSKLHELLVEL